MKKVFNVAWNSTVKGGADRIAYYISKYAKGFKAYYGYKGTLYKAKSYDIIANHTFVRGVVDFSKRYNKKLISIVHSPPFDLEHFPLQGYVIRNSDKVVVVNDWLKDFVCNTYGIDDDKVVVINNGSPIHLFKGINVGVRDYYVVGYHGRITEDKGVDKLIKAIEFLNEDVGIKVVLKLLGWRSMSIPRKRYIVVDNPTLDEKKVALWIDSIDLEVIPTKNDQQPLSAIEAMLRGKHVLMSKLNTLKEFDGLVNWIDKDISYKKLAFEIYSCLKHCSSYDGKLQRKAEEKFSIWRMIKDYEDLFNTV